MGLSSLRELLLPFVSFITALNLIRGEGFVEGGNIKWDDLVTLIRQLIWIIPVKWIRRYGCASVPALRKIIVGQLHVYLTMLICKTAEWKSPESVQCLGYWAVYRLNTVHDWKLVRREVNTAEWYVLCNVGTDVGNWLEDMVRKLD